MSELDLTKLKTLKSVEEEIANRRESVCRKVKMQSKIKDEKKEANAAYNEQLKDIQGQIDEEMGNIDQLLDHRKVLEK